MLGKRIRRSLLAVVVASGAGVIAPAVAPGPAAAAAANVCQVDGLFTSSGVGVVPPVGTSGWWSLSSLVVVCAGTGLVGTGALSGGGGFTPITEATYTASGYATFTVGSTTCSGQVTFGTMTAWAFTGQIDTACGIYALGGYLVPVIPSTSPPGHQTAVFAGVLLHLS